jgi:hypothetical protein
MDPDSDPDVYLDPAIFVVALQDANTNKTNFFRFSAYYFFKVHFIIFQFKDKKSKRSHKAVGIKVFLTIFNGDRRIQIRIHTSESDPDPDPGGPKTYGSEVSGFGSATLLVTIYL